MDVEARTAPKSYARRWLVLFAYCVLSAVMQMQWLTFAPIARAAREWYGVSALQIDLLSLVFMLVYVVASFPASFVIDTYGLRTGTRIGAAATAAFALARAAGADSYAFVLASQVGLALGQPFVLNAATKLASQWFPIRERGLAVGLATLAQFLGIIVVMIAMPALVAAQPIASALPRALWLSGGLALAAAVMSFACMRERPPTPPGPDEPREAVTAGLKRIVTQRDMVTLSILFTSGLGLFNAISTCIDQICEQKGLDVEQAGMIGAAQLIAGVAGAVIVPAISDRLQRRRPILIACTLGTVPGLIGLAWSADYTTLLLASGLLGFFLLGGGGPVGFQYAAEVSYPAPESTSQGLLLLLGQVSGIALIVGMNAIGMAAALWLCVPIGAATAVLSFRLRESPLMLTDAVREALAAAPERVDPAA